MIKKLQHKYALSEKGAKDLVRACVWVAISDMVLMLAAMVLYGLIKDLLENTLTKDHILYYAIGSAIVLILVAITQDVQYKACFLTTYMESEVRRTALAEKLRKLPLSFFGKKDLSDLTSNIMADCARMETAGSHWIPELIGALASTMIMGISMFFFFDARMVLASFWVIPVAFLIVVSSAGVQRNITRKTMQTNIVLADGVQECLDNVRDLRASNAIDQYMEGLEQKIKNVEKQTLMAEVYMAVFVSSAQMLLKVGIATTALVGGILLANGEITVLTYFLFLMLVSRIYDPMSISLQNFAAINSSAVNSERLDEILSHESQTGEEKLSNHGYDIVFDHVGFSYSDHTKVLEDVSFVAKQGEVTALIGPSGGGKTTISRLAARFWDTTKGTITVGGMDVNKTDPESLLSLYSIVFQDVTLFNNTILENIRIGKKDATDEEVYEAARNANCLEFIEKLPDGYNTMIGENGKELSGGERQRISIARAFLKDAPIILLDEATASLDVENETKIQKALSSLIQNKTVIIIAHRMRTIASADKIVVLKDGIVAEQGSPADLMEKDSIYKHMMQLQNQSMEWTLN